MTHESDRAYTEWRTADGRCVLVKDMTDGHLVNVINWIMDNKKSYSNSTLQVMIEEARYRQTPLFAEGRAYPQRVGNRWELIDPKTGHGKIEPPPADYIEAVKDNANYQRMSADTQKRRKARQA